MLRCVYAELGTGWAEDALGARALEACRRAGVELVLLGDEEAAERLGLRAWIADGALVLDGEELPAAAPAAAVARHRRARACAREDAIAVAGDLALAPAVGALWLVGGTPVADPLLSLELERHPNVRLAEGTGGAALYEAVVRTLME